MTPVKRVVATGGADFRANGVVIGLLLLALAGCGDTAGPANTVDTPQDQILFLSTRAADRFSAEMLPDIFRMNVDGTGVEQLTEMATAFRGLELSPDGKKVVFAAVQGGAQWLFVIGTDGSSLTQITDWPENGCCNYTPHWSPDGSLIGYTGANKADGTSWDAYVMNADGTGLVNVSNNPNTEYGTAEDWVDGWTPDGKVVLWSDRDGTGRTYVVNPDGTGLAPLLDGAFEYPYWSPDGTKVAVIRDDRDIHIMNADGTGDVNVTHDADHYPRYDRNPWSPDGSRIAFQAYDEHYFEDVYTVKPDGTARVNVSDDPQEDEYLGWSGDGTQVLFQSPRTGFWQIYRVNPDGTGLVNMTNSPYADNKEAIWVPRTQEGAS